MRIRLEMQGCKAVETFYELSLRAGLSSTTRGQGRRTMAFLLDCIQASLTAMVDRIAYASIETRERDRCPSDAHSRDSKICIV